MLSGRWNINPFASKTIALVLLSAVVLLNACGGDATPTPTPAPAPTSTSLPAPTATTIVSDKTTPQTAKVCAPGETPTFISDVVLAKDAQGANYEPVGITEAFEPSQATLHAIVTLVNAPKNLQLGATWHLIQASGYKPQKIDATTIEVADGGSRNVDFTLKGTQSAWPVGSYCVEIYANDKLALAKSFTVIAGESNAGSNVIQDIVLAESVKPDTFDPINPTDTFKKNAEAIHAVVRILDAPANTQLSAKWFPPSQEPLDFALPPVDGTRWLDFRLTPPPDGFPAGEYKVEIYVNQKLADTKTFTVQ
ncbi:MAG: hypothetical protein HDKAJFGB_00200 [Anaerolineae bacterium]|nr:hypothetical protein [Anaerolineae bacterium]